MLHLSAECHLIHISSISAHNLGAFIVTTARTPWLCWGYDLIKTPTAVALQLSCDKVPIIDTGRALLNNWGRELVNPVWRIIAANYSPYGIIGRVSLIQSSPCPLHTGPRYRSRPVGY